MTHQRGTGLLDEDDELVGRENVEKPLAGLVGIVSRPASIRYDRFLDTILDQGDTNYCVGCAISTAVYLRGQLTTPVQRPSAKLIVDLAQLANGDVELVNAGCRPADAIRMSSDKGLVAWDEWPLFTEDPDLLALRPREDVPWVNTPPPFDVFHTAYDARVTGYFRADFGDIVGLLEAALAIGQIPVFGMRVAHDYGAIRTEVYDAPSGVDPAGLPAHMQAICGYDADAFDVVTSWGYGHGNRGIVRIRKSFIADPRWCNSRIVVTSVPKRIS